MEDEKYISNMSSDPTMLTTQQLIREVSSLKELVFSRLVGIEKSITVSHDDLVRVPTDVQKQVGALKELMESRIDGSDKLKEEKFKNIDKRLDLVEQARIEQKKDTATAVDAALKAAKEAVTEQNTSNVLAINKSETATTKQIDQQGVLIAQISKNFDEKINDLKTKLAVSDGQLATMESLKGQVAALMSGSYESKGKGEVLAKFAGWIVAAIIAAIGYFLKK